MSGTHFITGVGGFVASHLVDYLLEQNEQVVGTYRWIDYLENIKYTRDRIALTTLDLIDLNSCITAVKTFKPDYIYHLAAQSFVPESFTCPAATLQINVIGTCNLLEAVRLTRELDRSYDPIVFICSSSEVYGQVTQHDIPIKESCPFRPASPYAVSKVAEDMLGLQYFLNYGIKTIRSRMFTHTGERRIMLSAESAFARQIARIECGKQEPVLKVGNLDSVRTYADVKDAVRAYYLLMQHCVPGDVYNIAGDRTLLIRDVLDILLSYSTYGGKINVEVDPLLLRPSDVTLQIADTSKFREATGWKPEIPLEDTLRGLLDWWRTNV